MFKVKLLEVSQKGNPPLLSGVTFGIMNRPIIFQISAEEEIEPLTFKFKVVRDKKKKSVEVERIPIKDLELEFIFYNPLENVPSGLFAPIFLTGLARGEEITSNELGFMFFVDCLPEQNTYRLTYEFYEGIPSVKEGDAQ